VLWLNPRLPKNIGHLCLSVRYRDRSLIIEISDGKLTIQVAGVTPKHIRIGFKNEIYELRQGHAKEFVL
jgi:trehalose/maltose hydrolase-like predicted phosphorylase